MKDAYHKIVNFISSFLYRKNLYSYPRDYYYETLLDKYSDGEFYSNLITNLNVLNGIKVNAEIRHLNNKTFNRTVIKDIIKKYGKPNYKIIYKDLLEIKILFYKHKISRHKTKLEFHFFKNNLFFYNYTFSYLNHEDKDEIIKIFKEKYFVEKYHNMINSYIIDKNNNYIIMDDNIYFSINYLCGKNIAWEKILEYTYLKKIKDVNKHKKHRKLLYDKL